MGKKASFRPRWAHENDNRENRQMVLDYSIGLCISTFLLVYLVFSLMDIS